MKPWIGAVALAFAARASAQVPEPLFAGPEAIHIAIKAPFSTFTRNREDPPPIQGSITDPSGQVLPVTLAMRSTTRRKSDVCDFPPFRVTFTAPPPSNSVFAHQKKLKLVTHCRNSPAFQQYVLLEYSAYRMLNAITPRSFGVRLTNIDYVGPDGRPITSRIGFFLEELKDVAKRNGMKETHGPSRIPVTDLSPPDAARYALFQHMIANHDWSMRAGPEKHDCCHNAMLIGPLAPGSTIPIPYDFDFSGFVSPPYATPPDELHLSSVRERLYRGYCMHNSEAVAAARELRAARPQIIAAITSTPGMEPRTQQRAIAFLDPFFSDIATDQSVNARVLNHCVN